MRNDANGTAPQQLVWHYSKGGHLKSILSEGVIRLSVGDFREQPAAVWFSADQTWEPTVYPKFAKDMGKLYRWLGGLVRVGVYPEVAPMRWANYRQACLANTRSSARGRMPSGAMSEWLSVLALTAEQCGASPDLWRVSLKPVPRSKWIAVETWESGRWQPYQGFSTSRPNGGESLHKQQARTA